MPVAEWSKALGKSYPAIRMAEGEAAKKLCELKSVVEDAKIDSSDISIVVFGSLARSEWTSGSDLDWTLLIDGEADHEHANTANELSALLEAKGIRGPGKSRTFGTLTFSHELIHQIGGADDTNRNTTKRLLLLLESIPANLHGAYDRVVTAVLRRYLENDVREFRLKIPRFLLNDCHRFWRTMCVDYANKCREEASENWGLRNAKLRMSRKLIFASGLLTCFACDRSWIELRRPELIASPSVDGLVAYMTDLVRRTPLETVADAASFCGKQDAAVAIMDAYDEFLELLNDPDARTALNALKPQDAEADERFAKVQELGRRFQHGLEALFFDCERLGRLTREYGVF